tara:strand:- start:698 stop:1258 length:561 start_codon:yes stop_codon:yes gene_type:complete
MNEKYVLYLLGFIIIYIMFKVSAKILKLLLLLSVGFVFFVLLNGCSTGNLNNSSSIEDAQENTLTRIKDMPFVMRTELNIEESLLMGEGKSWSGQLLMTVPATKAEVFNFYVKNLGEFGWKEQTTIRGKTSILNYIGENNRVAIIMIKEEGLFNNSSVLISVSPYGEEFEDKIGDYINEKYLEITE